MDDEFRSNFCEQDGKEHVACPLVWISKSPGDDNPDPTDIEKYLGGHDATLDWCRDFMKPAKFANDRPEADMVNDGYKADHGYDYDVSDFNFFCFIIGLEMVSYRKIIIIRKNL